MSFLEFLNM